MLLSNLVVLIALTKGISVSKAFFEVPMKAFKATIVTESGSKLEVHLDPMSDYTTVHAKDAGYKFALSESVRWFDYNVFADNTTDSVLGLSPTSAFIAEHPIVTFNPVRGKLIVGSFDVGSECREKRMAYAPQDEEVQAWRLPFSWDAGKFKSGNIDFDIGFYADSFIIPRPYAESFEKFLSSRIDEYEEDGDTYTPEHARMDLPTIHMALDAFKLSLKPSDYVTAGPDTEFGSSKYREACLPVWILRNLIVQLDAANHRVGVCTAR